MRKLILSLALLLAPSAAYGQCSGQFASGQVCGNSGASQALPTSTGLSAMVDRAFGSARGDILYRNSTGWTALPPGTNGQFLKTQGAGADPVWVTGGSGSVVSVGLVAPGEFTVSGSPVTTSGSLTLTKATQSPNLVWAGPTSGGVAQPAFRSLVGADLPNPSSSSLGGIQSTVGASHQWVSSISTSGVPGLSQPAFSDISGSITPGQCPNPSASTIGCVQSFAFQASKWISSISTLGVPSATTPDFTDISGSLVQSQLPVAANNTVIANVSGGSTFPVPSTVTSILDVIGAVQGDVLYRNASSWVVLPPGTNGQVFTTSGAAANPSWTTVTGTGTVTSIATNNGLTGGTITTTGTIGLATIATGNVLAYTGAGSGVPVATTPTTVLDVIGSVQGDILYRGASNWTVLAPGTNGQVLQTQGAGSTPQWANAGSVSSVGTGTCLNGGAITSSGTIRVTCVPLPQGRLTLTSGTPVMTANATAQSTIYYDCYNGGNNVPYWDGTNDQVDAIAACEVSMALQNSGTGLTGSGNVFDVWWVHSGANRVCVATDGSGGGWSHDTGGSNTARGTGFSQIDKTTRPYITNTNALTHCYNGVTDYGSIPANRATYLGTFYSTSNGQTGMNFKPSAAAGGTNTFIALSNGYNRVHVAAWSQDSTVNWTYGSATWHVADSGATGSGLNNRVSMVDGLAGSSIMTTYSVALFLSSSSAVSGQMGVALDSTSSTPNEVGVGRINMANGSIFVYGTSHELFFPQVGFHFFQAMENAPEGTAAFQGAAFNQTSALIIELEN